MKSTACREETIPCLFEPLEPRMMALSKYKKWVVLLLLSLVAMLGGVLVDRLRPSPDPITGEVRRLLNQAREPNFLERSLIDSGLMEWRGPYFVAVTDGLARLGKAAVPALVEALKDSDPDVRYCAVSALGDMGPEAKAAVAALIDAMKDSEWPVRRGGAWALGRIGPAAKAAIPALEKALQDPDDEELRKAAAVALEKIRDGQGSRTRPAGAGANR